MPLLSLQTVNILSACVVMSVVWLHAGALCCLSPSLSFFVGGPVISICLCYVCRCISFFHSTLKSCYSVSFTYCTLDVWPPSAGFCSAVLVISRHCFRCYLSTPHAVWVLLLCRVRVISQPSLLLSLHYLRGYRSAVVPVLSYATIKVVTFLSDSVLKCTQGCLGGSF